MFILRYYNLGDIMGCCYIFGSMDIEQFNFKIESEDILIAADKGLLNAEKFGIKADIIVGDFDSLKYTPSGENVIKHPKMKDETDLILAVDTGIKKGYKNFKIFGCLGGRLDQTYATIQTAEYIKEKNGYSEIYGNNEKIIILHQGETIHYDKNEKGVISVFSYSKSANISINGLLYELNDKEIYNSYPLGVSNEFNHSPATITVNKGKILIIQNI